MLEELHDLALGNLYPRTIPHNGIAPVLGCKLVEIIHVNDMRLVRAEKPSARKDVLELLERDRDNNPLIVVQMNSRIVAVGGKMDNIGNIHNLKPPRMRKIEP